MALETMPTTCSYGHPEPKASPLPSTPAAMLAEMELDCAGWNRLVDRPGCTRFGRIQALILEPRNMVFSDAAITGIVQSINQFCTTPSSQSVAPGSPQGYTAPMAQQIDLGVSCMQWAAMGPKQKVQAARAAVLRQYGSISNDATVPTLIAQMNQACAANPTASNRGPDFLRDTSLPGQDSATALGDTTPVASTKTNNVIGSSSPQSSTDGWWLLGGAALLGGAVWWLSRDNEKRPAKRVA